MAVSALTRAIAGLLAAAGLLGGCATVTRYDAAADIHAFLIAVRDGDRETFDAHVDRPALSRNLKARLLSTVAGEYGVQSRQTAGALLAGPLVDIAVEALVRPQVFRAAATLAGYGPETRIPNALVLGQGVKPLGSDRACAMIKDKCAFIFKREEGAWRLIAFEGDIGLLKKPGKAGALF